MRYKEAELTRAVLIYASESLYDGDWAALRDLGFGEPELRALQLLSIGDMTLLSRQLRLHGHILKIQVDRDAFQQLLVQIQRESERYRMKWELVCRDAPAELMASLYNVGVREYMGLRRAFRLSRGPGRPPDPDEHTIETVWQAWKTHCSSRALNELAPHDWLTLAEATGRDLRLVYRVLRDSPTFVSPPQRHPQHSG